MRSTGTPRGSPGPALSLTCGDGAVPGVVVKPVEVFAALRAEVERACDRGGKTGREGSRGRGRGRGR